MAKQVVCHADELPPGTRTVVRLGGRAIGVFNIDSRYYALRDVCPHQGASLCAGTVGGTMLPSRPHEYVWGLEGRIVRCPWHGLEFDLENGRSLSDPDRWRVHTYPASVENGNVVVDA